MKKILVILSCIILTALDISSQNNKSNDLFLQAVVKFDKQKYADAQNLLTDVIKNNTEDYQLYLKRGESFYCQKRYKNAIADFKIAEKKEKGSANYFIAKSYAKLNNISETIKYLRLYLKSRYKLLEAEIKLDPAFSEIESSKQWINLWKEKHYSNYEKKLSDAKYCISTDKISDAFDILDSEIKKNKTRHFALYQRAILYLKINDNKKALNDLNKCVKLKPKNTEYLFKRAKTLYRLSKFKNAVEDYNNAIKLEPNNLALFYNKSISENKLGAFSDALISINKYLKYYPDDAKALYLCGKINFNTEDYLISLEKYNKCIEYNSSKAKYFEARGDCYFKTKIYKYAVKDYSMSLDLYPRSGEVYFKMAMAEYESGNYKNACHNWKTAERYRYFKASDYLQKYCRSSFSE